ncbi:MAG: TonB-dependent receptor, partial [Bacteroidales bacterium]|nr:TonB-dependent receptor [Bacteroidales bacterium]
MMKKRLIPIVLLCIAYTLTAQTGEIRGTVIEKSTGEPIIGATVMIAATNNITTTDLQGNYTLKATTGVHSVLISCISYQTVALTDVTIETGKVTHANAALEENATGLDAAVVVAVRRMNSEVAMISAVRTSHLVLSAVSSQQITRTQDRDASEVVKRIPGISVIDNRFIIARGLAQR